MLDTIQICTSLVDYDRPKAAGIFHEAFSRKLMPILGHPTEVQQLLSESLIGSHIFSAYGGQELVGIAGLEFGDKKFYQASLKLCITYLGLWYGLVAWIVLALFMEGTCQRTEIRIAALAVNSDWRGKGIGTRLIEEVVRFADWKGYTAIRLEVVDTNTGALQLYQRMGFKVVRQINFGFLTRWLGFTGELEMIRQIPDA
jgi:ribosomal protein S18 acetylase RimI-like enzyme